MFTTGRIIFTIVFIVVFVAGMIWAYRKDMKQIRLSFPKPWIVLLSLILILVIYYVFARVF